MAGTDRDELRYRFQHHPPSSTDVAELHQQLRQAFGDVADEAAHLLPPCRELSIVFTKLEEALMWANTAVARHQNDSTSQ